jgi:excisionase family DNA binding protein
MDTNSKLLLTVVETAEVLNVSVPSINRRIADGSIPSIRLGGRRLIPRQELEATIAKMTRGARA